MYIAIKNRWKTFIVFGIQQALSCVFPVMVFALLALSHHFTPIIPRYDFMLITCVLVQVVMYYTRIETKDELLVICIFHLLGLMMELFKVHIGSWSYPEFAYFKFWGVPLYSGFMYASVASYMCQAWRRFNLKITDWPNHWYARFLGIMIYLNFFTNHYIQDVRYYIGILNVFFFRKAKVCFNVEGKTYRMPVIISFVLIGFFIWLAENLATFLGAWKYAYQHTGWAMVNYQKISSWAFLVIVSYIIVAELKMLKKSISKN
jgi:uncharacterized membrane protein YoaT (DUF817 family)